MKNIDAPLNNPAVQSDSRPSKNGQQSNLPLIVQSNFKILLETRSPIFSKVRDVVGDFLELVHSPDLFYTYSLNEISLWNGFSKGYTDKTIIDALKKFSKFHLPKSICKFIESHFLYYGMFRFVPADEKYYRLISDDPAILKKILHQLKISDALKWDVHEGKKTILFPHTYRGVLKSELVRLGFPVQDLIGYLEGKSIKIDLQKNGFSMRPYQEQAIESFFFDASKKNAKVKENSAGKNSKHSQKNIGQSGLVVLPCGAGKTVVGIGIITKLKKSTLIIVPNIISLKQWKNELLSKTNIDPERIGEYVGKTKKISDITIATYQQLTYRKNKNAEYLYLSLFNNQDWGLIIYDEVHMLPANVFRFITGIQSRRRLGLTATLVREDHKEREVYSLIGPKKFDLPWKLLEQNSFLAQVHCFEVNVKMGEELEYDYFNADSETMRFRMVAENPRKTKVLKKLLTVFQDYQIIVIGQYLNQLFKIARELNLPIITGKTPQDERKKMYEAFNDGLFPTLLVSKIANFAVDLPNAEVAIQLSGTYGSRQEEAQRLGRIIRPKTKSHNSAYFFSLVTGYSREELLAQNRKSFLTTQGYFYHNINDEDILSNDEKTLQKQLIKQNTIKNPSTIAAEKKTKQPIP